MKSLKEKIQETTKQHKKEVADNLRDRAIHVGNLKNIRPGDNIFTYYSCFYHTAKQAEVIMIDGNIDAIYINLHNIIMRFHMFNCRKWGLDDKKPCGERTTRKENREIATGSFCDLIRYPIINIKYKSKLPISKNFLCCDEKELLVCPRLTWAVTGSYWCNHLGEYLTTLNSKGCK